MNIRRIIADEMKRQRMTQTALAERARLTQPRVSDYLRGRRELRGDTLSRLLPALGLTVARAPSPAAPPPTPFFSREGVVCERGLYPVSPQPPLEPKPHDC